VKLIIKFYLTIKVHSINPETIEEHSTVLQCQFSGSMFCIAGTGVEPTTSPAGDVLLTTGILFFLFIVDINSKGIFLKPCGRTTQFFAGLHCQSESSAGQSSLGGCLASRSGWAIARHKN
jgi:hypothetical protein